MSTQEDRQGVVQKRPLTVTQKGHSGQKSLSQWCRDDLLLSGVKIRFIGQTFSGRGFKEVVSKEGGSRASWTVVAY